MSQAKLFVVDDDEAARTLLAEALVKEGYEVEAFSSGQAAVERGKQSRADVVLTDIRMEQGDGFLVLKEFKKFSPDTSIVLLTAFGSLEGAIEAIKQGAYDYLAKPFKRDEIRLVVQRSLEHCRLVRENARFREDARAREPWSQLVGSSPAMLEVYKLVARVSEGRSTVLIEGESGTGKELIARAVHLNSPRRDKPFIPVNCGALPDHLLESEMFGYEKGAFTGAVGAKAGLFEAANGGTLFLDEISELPLMLQAKLLRVLEERTIRRVGSAANIPIDVRVMAATNRNLKEAVAKGEFREDLYFRLNVVTLTVPPLRERREDIIPLAEQFLYRSALALKKPVRSLGESAQVLLRGYHLPGNVRELSNLIERAVLFCAGTTLEASNFPIDVQGAGSIPVAASLDTSAPEAGGSDSGDVHISFRVGTQSLADLEDRIIEAVLARSGGNKTLAAKQLGVTRWMLDRRRKPRV